jgi:Nucleotidyltransferase domain
VDIQALINDIVERVKQVDGVSAIVLGGSRAIGTHTEKSDIDLCFYYYHEHLLDLKTLDKVAAEFDDSHQLGKITPINGWGPWINGGGWLTVNSQSVDFLYRDLNKVETVIQACHNGHVDIFYQPGHPHGFVSSIYMAEVALCKILWEADDRLSALKLLTSPYPPALKKAIIEKFNWEINFALDTANKSIERTDIAYAAGCCFRAVMCMLQVLFALNEQYWLNEKGAVALAGTFQIAPKRLQARIEEMFGLLAADRESISAAISVLEGLQRDTTALIASRQPSS